MRMHNTAQRQEYTEGLRRRRRVTRASRMRETRPRRPG
jgi:hypothetical protein